MKIDNKLILECSKELNVLYVEDDDALRNATKKIFANYFKTVETAIDGKEGLEKFLSYQDDNDACYDLIISDINMPYMNGIDMSMSIVAENPGQSIIFITAHDEASYLHSAIKVGANGFLNKPIDQDQLKTLLYKTTQAISDRKLVDSFYQKVEDLNMKLEERNEQISKEKAKLEAQIRLYKAQENSANLKHRQVEQLLESQKSEIPNSLVSDYFAGDDDEGGENVLFLSDDCDEIGDIFDDISNLLITYSQERDVSSIEEIVVSMTKISSILLRYTPFLDPLAESFAELGSTIKNHTDEFVKMLEESPDDIMMVYDAVGVDMDRYMARFSVESMAMKNIHHIHHPTTLSIQQIAGMIAPQDLPEGEIDFF
jgi:CheY-like chemotaxis protein